MMAMTEDERKRRSDKSMAGRKFGEWTVIAHYDRRHKNRLAFWLCVCDCGTFRAVRGDILRSKQSARCRKCAIERRRLEFETGKTYGRLTVLSEITPKYTPGTKRQRYVKCQCSCGDVITILLNSLTSGKRTMCEKCSYIHRGRRRPLGITCSAHKVKTLSDYYVGQCLMDNSNLTRKNIPQDLIELKRIQLTITRILRERKHR